MKKFLKKNWLILTLCFLFLTVIIYRYHIETIRSCGDNSSWVFAEPGTIKAIVPTFPVCSEYKVFINIGPKICSLWGFPWDTVCESSVDCVTGCILMVK